MRQFSRTAFPLSNSRGRLAVVALLVFWAILPSTAAAQTPKAKKAKAAAPAGPADYESKNFLIHTDLSPNESQELLERLETMLKLISDYWGEPLRGGIECYVVKDLDKWPPGGIPSADGLAKIEEGAGITLSQKLSQGKNFLAKAVVYAVADRGTPQHEAVHAYCAQTFGTTGPLWYSEGMAEMGNYWRDDDRSVNIHPGVLEYLQNTPPKSLNGIVNANEFTGDSWQNYAWRWALCHMLAHNTNYAPRFLPLGLGFLEEREVSFEQVYGPMAAEISFEYLFFLEHIDQGYRVDLCSFDWNKKFTPLRGGSAVSPKVAAARGWQPSGVLVTAGEEYEYSASGKWKTAKGGSAVNGDGGSDGAGRLEGVVLKDFKLTEPFALGAYGSFAAPGDGKLYLRCQDAWNQVADNDGKLTVKLKLKGKGRPLAPPRTELSEKAELKEKPGPKGKVSAGKRQAKSSSKPEEVPAE